MSIHGYAYLTWVYELFVRKHDWSRTDIGLSFGSISMVTGILGSLLAGYFAGRMLRRGTKDAALRLTLLAVLVMTPTAIVMPLVDNAQLAIYLCIPLSFCMAMPAGLNLAVLQAVAPNRMRGQLVAIYMISVGFLSYLLAPLGIALLNDYVFKSEDAIDLSLALSASLNYPVALACLFLALKPFREAVVKLGDEFR
jgi:MFS family permease